MEGKLFITREVRIYLSLQSQPSSAVQLDATAHAYRGLRANSQFGFHYKLTKEKDYKETSWQDVY